MLKNKLVSVIMLLFLLFLSGCKMPESSGSFEYDTGSRLQRRIDREAGVVCWSIAPDSGLDCMPISETKLLEKGMALE